MENPGPSCSAENTSQKMFIGTDKISEILNDLDSDVGSCKLSDSDVCEVNSPLSNNSSSEEEEVVQPKSHRGKKRKQRAILKRTNTDFEFGWKEQIQTVQNPAFSGVPGINKNYCITQDSYPWDIFEIFFNPQMFKLI
jgi:hypothetical protein